MKNFTGILFSEVPTISFKICLKKFLDEFDLKKMYGEYFKILKIVFSLNILYA